MIDNLTYSSTLLIQTKSATDTPLGLVGMVSDIHVTQERQKPEPIHIRGFSLLPVRVNSRLGLTAYIIDQHSLAFRTMQHCLSEIQEGRCFYDELPPLVLQIKKNSNGIAVSENLNFTKLMSTNLSLDASGNTMRLELEYTDTGKILQSGMASQFHLGFDRLRFPI